MNGDGEDLSPEDMVFGRRRMLEDDDGPEEDEDLVFSFVRRPRPRPFVLEEDNGVDGRGVVEDEGDMVFPSGRYGRRLRPFILEDDESTSDEEVYSSGHRGVRRFVITDEEDEGSDDEGGGEDEGSDDEGGGEGEGEEEEGFISRMLEMDVSRANDERVAMLRSAFTSRPERRSAAALMRSLRDFLVLAKHGQVDIVMAPPRPRTP